MSEKYHCNGKCPKCGSDNYRLTESEEQDSQMIYYYECNDCRCEFNETYLIVYQHTEINEPCRKAEGGVK